MIGNHPADSFGRGVIRFLFINEGDTRMTDSISGQWSRRQVLHSIPAALIAPSLHAGSFRTRPRIAAVVTEYRRYSHAQHILDRYLMGYGWNNQHHLPPVDLVSLYVDQQPENDLSQARAQEFPQLKIYPSIEEALTLGGEELAVDGVLLIAEHGDYPKNEMGQTLYPRYEFFRRIVDVFEHSGRTAPVFNDKHLSWSWDQAKEMGSQRQAKDNRPTTHPQGHRRFDRKNRKGKSDVGL